MRLVGLIQEVDPFWIIPWWQLHSCISKQLQISNSANRVKNESRTRGRCFHTRDQSELMRLTFKPYLLKHMRQNHSLKWSERRFTEDRKLKLPQVETIHISPKPSLLLIAVIKHLQLYEKKRRFEAIGDSSRSHSRNGGILWQQQVIETGVAASSMSLTNLHKK